jgi:cytochrome c peroxidase
MVTPLASYAEPCAARPHLLVLRLVAGWCGTCRWYAANTQSTIATEAADRVRVADVLLANDDNGPPGKGDIAVWRARGDGVADVFWADPTPSPGLLPAGTALPLIVLIDTRAMAARALLSDPDPDALANEIRAQVAAIDGNAPPPAIPVTRFDDRFTREAWDMIRAMALTASPPADPTNRVADDPSAAALGKQLFFDGSLSPASVSCSSCHDPSLLFTDGKGTPPEGTGPGSRNAPSLVLAAYQRWQLWDGRADSLWMQALLPMEASNEFGSSRLFVVHAVAEKYRAPFESLFGPLPPLSDVSRFPPAGMPGDAAWASMAPSDAALVTGAFVDVGKAIEAYERSLRVAPNALDAYAAGRLDALTNEQKDGLAAFFAAGCAQCHHGPRLTDDAFHNLRFPTGRPDATGDPGRAAGIPLLVASDFLGSGPFSDAPKPALTPVAAPATLGAFKTPGLRGVPFTMPYGHGGSFGGLSSTLEAHRSGGVDPSSPFAVGAAEPYQASFDPGLVAPILTFLQVLRLDVQP